MCPDSDDEYEEILDCNLIESLPPSSPRLPQHYPNPEAFRAKAHQQHVQSRLFQLPAEIRQAIFLELWRSAGLTQHIFLQDGRYAHAQCLVERDADESQGYFESLGLQKSWEASVDGGLNKRRLLSPWCKHWRCEEAILRAQQRRGSEHFASNYRVSHMPNGLDLAPSPFLAVLLTCKEMYFECAASIHSSVTFSFTSATTALDFLATRSLPMGDQSAVHHIRNIDLSCRVELEGPDGHCYGGEPLATWDSVMRTLPSLASLASVRCWLDSPSLTNNVLLGSNSRPLLSVDARLARILTVDFPVDEKYGIQWEVWPQEKFRMRPRACERYVWSGPQFGLFD